jgi:hypothetical protein
MNSLQQSTRAIFAALVLSLSACNSASILKGSGYSDPRLAGRIEQAYEARDVCLARNATPSVSGEPDIATIAKAVSLSCMPETNRLIAIVNPHHDPRVTTAMLKDNDDKAMRYVMLARDEARI